MHRFWQWLKEWKPVGSIVFPTSPTSLFSACNSEVFQASQVSKVGRSKCRSVFLQLNEPSTPKQATGLSVQLSHPKLVQKTSRGGVRPFFSWDLRLQRQTPFLCHRDGIRRHLSMVPIPPGRRPNCWCVIKLTGPRPVTGYSVDRFQELALRENWPDITDLITHDFILNIEKRNVQDSKWSLGISLESPGFFHNINPAIGISMSESHSTGVMNAAPTGAAHSFCPRLRGDQKLTKHVYN